MRTIFMSLLVSLILLLTINGFVYALDNDVKVDGRKISYTLRETSNGIMVELSKDDYKYILTTALTERERAILWEKRYNQLLKDTVWEESYNEALTVIDNQEDIISDKDKKINRQQTGIKILTGTTISFGLGALALFLTR